MTAHCTVAVKNNHSNISPGGQLHGVFNLKLISIESLLKKRLICHIFVIKEQGFKQENAEEVRWRLLDLSLLGNAA